MRSQVFIETSIVSYLTALPNRNAVHTAHRQLTRDWWEKRDRFDLYTSQAVLREAARGDVNAAARRLAAFRGIPVLAVTEEASDLAEMFLRKCDLPAKASIDAIHIAVAVVNGMDYLLTWNCAHIANAAIRGKIEKACRDADLQPPLICTPEELMEE